MATKDIDLPHLTLKDALDLAIIIEEEARDRYLELAESLELHHTPDAAAFFMFMAKNEEKHRADLAERRLERFGDQPRSVGPLNVFDIEAPEYDDARAFMTVRQALDMALQAELKAQGFFVSVLSTIEDPKVRALLEELRDEEVEHQDMVKAQIAKLPLKPEPRPDDYADEPAPQ